MSIKHILFPPQVATMLEDSVSSSSSSGGLKAHSHTYFILINNNNNKNLFKKKKKSKTITLRKNLKVRQLLTLVCTSAASFLCFEWQRKKYFGLKLIS